MAKQNNGRYSIVAGDMGRTEAPLGGRRLKLCSVEAAAELSPAPLIPTSESEPPPSGRRLRSPSRLTAADAPVMPTAGTILGQGVHDDAGHRAPVAWAIPAGALPIAVESRGAPSPEREGPVTLSGAVQEDDAVHRAPVAWAIPSRAMPIAVHDHPPAAPLTPNVATGTFRRAESRGAPSDDREDPRTLGAAVHEADREQDTVLVRPRRASGTARASAALLRVLSAVRRRLLALLRRT
jgi:hypothetical protein